MIYQHKELANGKWNKLNIFEQMANVGSEVERAILWREKSNVEYSKKAFERALELLIFTINDPKNNDRLKEIVRVYEVLADYFFGENNFSSTDTLWRKYFYSFTYASRVKNHTSY
ncbi:MAG: hypothetical protein ABIB98_03040 [bacterium]